MLTLLCAVFSTAWGQTNFSANYTSDEGALSTTGGTQVSTCKVVINENEYSGIKAGTGNNAGAVQISVPAGVEYVHLHVAGWSTENVTLSLTPNNSTNQNSITLTSNSGISNSSPFTFNGEASSASYYKVLTINRSYLSNGVTLKLTATSGKRFVVFGVHFEKKSVGPTLANPTFSPAGGTYSEAQNVQINHVTPGTEIYYTIDGSTPSNSNGTLYSNAIPINSTTTLKAIAFKDGIYSEVVSATYTINVPVEGYNIDFESEASSYSDWTFTNIVSNYINDNAEPHGGSKYGSTDGKASGSIQTKEKVATPQNLTCYVSKQSSNTTSSTWKIQVSSDGSSWTDVASTDAKDMDQGDWKKFTADLSSYNNVYIRVFYNGSTAVRLIDDLTLITEVPNTINFAGDYNPIIFNNLNGFVTSDDYADYSSIILTEKHGSSYAGWQAENVKSAENMGLLLKAGEGKITIPTINTTSSGVRVEVAVNKGQVKVKEATYSSTVPNPNTENNTIDGLTRYSESSYYTIECVGDEDAIISCIIIYAIGGGPGSNPTLSIPDVNLKVGQSKTLDVSTNSPGEIVFNTMSYDVADIIENVDDTGHKTYTVVGKAPGTANFEASLYTYVHDDVKFSGALTWFNVTVEESTSKAYSLFSGDLVEGDYVIFYDGKAMNNTVSNNRLQYEEVTPNNNVIMTDNKSIVWHIAPSGEYWTIKSLDNSNYAASTGTKNQATVMEEGTSDNALWTVSGSSVSGSSTYEFVNKKNSSNKVNANLRNNGIYGFACYASSTGGALSLYKCEEPLPEPFVFTINTLATDGESYYATIADLGEGYYKVTGDVDVKTVVINEEGKLEYTGVYSEDNIIPGNAAYLVVASAAGEYSFPAISTTEEVTLGENMLISTGEGNVTDDNMLAAAKAANPYHEGDFKFYKLSLNGNSDENSVGFYWGADKGAPFTYRAHNQAYLAVAVPKTETPGQAVAAYLFNGDKTGIYNITTTEVERNNNATYTLSGIRVENKQLPKGIYIKNGKKVVVR